MMTTTFSHFIARVKVLTYGFLYQILYLYVEFATRWVRRYF
jgi:hypothetical protein